MIYVKIADLFSDKILSGEFQAKSRVPSIRFTASNFNVNMNTVVRAYELLEQKRLIYKKRGKGYFVVDDARDRLIRVHRKMFRTELLPKVIREMQLLNISIDDVYDALNICSDFHPRHQLFCQCRRLFITISTLSRKLFVPLHPQIIWSYVIPYANISF